MGLSEGEQLFLDEKKNFNSIAPIIENDVAIIFIQKPVPVLLSTDYFIGVCSG